MERMVANAWRRPQRRVLTSSVSTTPRFVGGTDADEAATLIDRPEGAVPAYEEWRRRIADEFASKGECSS